MKRLLLCLVLLASTGCAMSDEFFFDTGWFDAPAEAPTGCGTAPRPGARIVPVAAYSGSVTPAGGAVPPPPPAPPQTREPDLLR